MATGATLIAKFVLSKDDLTKLNKARIADKQRLEMLVVHAFVEATQAIGPFKLKRTLDIELEK